MRKDLEASYIALRKTDLREEKVFERLVLLVLMVSHRAINDITQSHFKVMHFPSIHFAALSLIVLDD